MWSQPLHCQGSPHGELCWFGGTLLFFDHGHTACRILVPWLGIKPVPPAVEAQGVVTTGLPGNSWKFKVVFSFCYKEVSYFPWLYLLTQRRRAFPFGLWGLHHFLWPQSPARVSQSTDFNGKSCRPESSPSRGNRQVLLLAWEHSQS